MAPERELREGISSRQKIIAAVLVIILFIVIWQIIGLFGGEKSTVPPPMTPIHKVAPGGALSATAPPGTPNPNPTVAANPVNPNEVTPTELPPVREAPVTMDSQILDMQKKTDQKYVDQLNQLQILKLQREIAETNQAIASARLATVTAEKSVSDLLTRPTPPAPGTLGVLIPGTETGVTVPLQAPPPPPPLQPPVVVMPPIEYAVVSVSMQLGRWSAVINHENKLYSVTCGDILPDDGSIVTSINKNGVTLMRKGKRRRLTITSSL